LSIRATDRLSPGVIAGAVVGSVFAFLLILGIAYTLVVCLDSQPIYLKPPRSTFSAQDHLRAERARDEATQRERQEIARRREAEAKQDVWCSRYEQDGRLKYLALIAVEAKYELWEIPDRHGCFSHKMTWPWSIDQERSAQRLSAEDDSSRRNLRFIYIGRSNKTSEGVAQRYQEIMSSLGNDGLSWSQCHDFLRQFTSDIITLWGDSEFREDLEAQNFETGVEAPTWDVIIANRKRRERIKAERIEAERYEQRTHERGESYSTSRPDAGPTHGYNDVGDRDSGGGFDSGGGGGDSGGGCD
jgi:hypothetical protein